MDRYNGVTFEGQKSDYDGRLVVTDIIRYGIEQSLVYRAGYVDLAVPAEGDITILIDPTELPKVATKGKISTETTQDVKIEYFEGVTVSDNGDPIVVYNFNRINPVASPSKIYSSPTVTDTGTKYSPDLYAFIGVGGVGSQVSTITPGASSDEFSPYIDPDKKYLYRITNLSTADAAKIAVDIRFVSEPKYPLGAV